MAWLYRRVFRFSHCFGLKVRELNFVYITSVLVACGAYFLGSTARAQNTSDLYALEEKLADVSAEKRKAAFLSALSFSLTQNQSAFEDYIKDKHLSAERLRAHTNALLAEGKTPEPVHRKGLGSDIVFPVLAFEERSDATQLLALEADRLLVIALFRAFVADRAGDGDRAGSGAKKAIRMLLNSDMRLSKYILRWFAKTKKQQSLPTLIYLERKGREGY